MRNRFSSLRKSGAVARASLSAIALAGLTAAGKAQAVPETSVLEEITVTGERVERKVKDTGSSVAVIRDEDIKARRLNDVLEAFATTPNVQIANDGRDVVIRGVPKAGLAATEDVLTQSPNDVVSTFLDGVPISQWAGATSLWDIGQVEVFRGPQTTTSGRGSLGGAVFFRTLDPTPEWSARARAGYGSRDTGAFSGSVSGPLVPGKLGVRVSIDRQFTDGFIRNVTADKHQDIDKHTTARAKLVWDEGEGTRVDLSYTHSNRLKGGGLASLSDFPNRFVNVTDLPERLDKMVDVGSLSFRHELSNGWRIEGLTGLGREDATRHLDADTTAADIARARVDENTRQASQEFRIVRDDPSERWRGFLGFYGRAFERKAVNDISGAFNIVSDIKTRTRTVATFGEATFDATPELHLTAGGRLEHDSYRTHYRSAGDRTSDDTTTPLPKVSVAYDWTPSVTTIGTVQRSYRAGGAGASLFTGSRYSYDPEYTWTYEAALRTRWFYDRVEVNLNAFHTDWRDQQVESQIDGNPFNLTIINAGKSEVDGAELETRFKVSPDLTVFANGALLKTRFKKFVSGGVDFSGNKFPFAAPYQLGAGFAWAHPSGFALSADVNYLGKSYSNIENVKADKLDGRFLVNGVASYTWNNVTASIIGKNIFDERYAYVKASQINAIGPGARRTVMGEVRVEF